MSIRKKKKEIERLISAFEREADLFHDIKMSTFYVTPNSASDFRKFESPNHTIMLWQYYGNLDGDDDIEQLYKDMKSSDLKWGLRGAEFSSFAVVEGKTCDLFARIDSRDGNNEFFETMSKLEINIPEGSRIIICAEPKLQQLPLNVLVKDNGFLGQSVSTCYVPSISWLKNQHSLSGGDKNKRAAWVSISSDSMGTLEVAYARLEESFNKFGFDISTESKVPSICSDSQIAVITAHGGLIEDNKYFHKIADEQGFHFTPRVLASSIKNCDLPAFRTKLKNKNN